MISLNVIQGWFATGRPRLPRATAMAFPANGPSAAIGPKSALPPRSSHGLPAFVHPGPVRPTNLPKFVPSPTVAQPFARSWNALGETGEDRLEQTFYRKMGDEEAWLMSMPPPRARGQPLSAPIQAYMESLFGVSFSDVRIHVGHHVNSIGAFAYTQGTDVHFAPGRFNPYSIEGVKLLAHELTHVIQQREGRVKNPFGRGVAIVANRALEQEADLKAAEASARRPMILWSPDNDQTNQR